MGLADVAGAAAAGDPRRHRARRRARGLCRGGAGGVRRSAAPSADARMHECEAEPDAIDRPLGAARAQIHETYIVAQTRDGMVIVDQHAAHERLVYERMKAALAKSGVARQILLIPDIVELDEADVERLVARADDLAALRPRGRELRPRRGRGARDAGPVGRDRQRRPGARSRRAHGRMGLLAAAGAAADACGRDHGLPRLGAGRAPAQAARR